MKIVLADHTHEPALRRLIGEEAMPGWIRLRYGREPDFFRGLRVEGTFTQAFVCLTGDREVVGMGTRAAKSAWIDGESVVAGYLGGLRIRPGARRGTALARGYRFLGELHQDRRCRFYLTSILEANVAALELLTSRRAGLPHYLAAGRFFCHVVAPRTLAKIPGAARGRLICSGEEIGTKRLLDFLGAVGRRRQFFPVLREEEFGTPTLRDLSPGDFLVVSSPGGEILGCAALWDQTRFKQLRVAGYSRNVALALPVLRPLARLALGLSLPSAGEELRLLNLAFLCVRDDDPAVLAALLRAGGRSLRSRDYHGIVFGFHQSDPLRPRRIPGFVYASRVFLVCWDEDAAAGRRLLAGSRPLHLEVSSM